MSENRREPFDPWLIPPGPPMQKATAAASQGPQTVSQITAAIRLAITRSLPASVSVVGQISNLKRHTSGHLYLTLKDAHSELPCVMWRTEAARLKFKAADGLEVVATGGIEVFDRAGRYQLYIRKLEPRGVGSLELAFRQLYERLAGEGLFDPARKKSIPRFPRRIAIVTSPTGAAIADMLRTIERRFPCVTIFLFPVRVQGEGAAMEIASAVRIANASADKLGGIDTLILARGGGSLEDLWPFNEEIVARAVFGSRIPVISGVGHEVDTTIADLVSDVRAATPTAAAQLAVPVLSEILQDLLARQNRLSRGVLMRAELFASRMRGVTLRGALRDPMLLVRSRSQTVDLVMHKAQRGQLRRLHNIRAKLEGVERIVQKIAPHALLGRVRARLEQAERALVQRIRRAMNLRRELAQGKASKLERLSPSRKLPALEARATQSGKQLYAAMCRSVEKRGERLKSASSLLAAVSHKSVLERGYSITRLKESGKLVRSVGDIVTGEVIRTQVRDGEFDSKAGP